MSAASGASELMVGFDGCSMIGLESAAGRTRVSAALAAGGRERVSVTLAASRCAACWCCGLPLACSSVHVLIPKAFCLLRHLSQGGCLQLTPCYASATVCSLTGNYSAAPRRTGNGGGRSGSRSSSEAATGEGSASGNGSSGRNGASGNGGNGGSNGGNGSGAEESASSLVPHGPGSQFREVGTGFGSFFCAHVCSFYATATAAGLQRFEAALRCCRVGGRRGGHVTMLPQQCLHGNSRSCVSVSLPKPYAVLPVLQVLVVPLPLKPLFPGGIMPVTVTNNKLIKELFEIRKSG